MYTCRTYVHVCASELWLHRRRLQVLIEIFLLTAYTVLLRLQQQDCQQSSIGPSDAAGDTRQSQHRLFFVDDAFGILEEFVASWLFSSSDVILSDFKKPLERPSCPVS